MLPHDFTSHLTHFCRALRQNGMLVGPQETADAIRAVETAGIMSQTRVYWSLRALLVSRKELIPTFDKLFAQFWNFDPPSTQPPSDPRPKTSLGQTRSVARLPRGLAAPQDDPRSNDIVIQLLRTGASPRQATGGRDLSSLADGEDLAKIHRIAARVVRALASRPGRRRKKHPRRGTPDLRSALRLSLSTGGDPVLIPRRRRVRRSPRLLVLLDVSGSMDRHARLMLRLAYAVRQQTRRVETFAFSAAITRITRALDAPNFEEALHRAGRAVDHWSGGTKIGESLRLISASHERLLDGFTAVIILSDGWETGDTRLLARELSKMRIRTRRLIWLNPLAGTQDFQPLARGLQAAMPYIDHFAPASNVSDLERLPAMLRTRRD